MRPKFSAYVYTSTLCMVISIAIAHQRPGEIIPRDNIEIKAGDSINITCRMNLEVFDGRDSTSLYFQDEDNRVVPSSDIAILDTSSIVYMLRNAPVQNKEYRCMVSGLGLAVDLTRVRVGYEPMDVEDFRCRGYDYTYLQCNFTIPNNTIPTTYKLGYKAIDPDYINNCPMEIVSTQATCKITENDNYRYTYEIFNFTLTSTNALGIKKQNFVINHFQSVRPPAPAFKFEQIKNDSVALVWNLARYALYGDRGFVYEILIRPENFDWQNHSNYEIHHKGAVFKLTLRNLPYAFYRYIVRLRMKVRAAVNDETMWSDPHQEEFRTARCLPPAPPKTDVGSYYIDSMETTVRLYWQELPAVRHNGPNFKYVVTEMKRDGAPINLLVTQNDSTSAVFPWDKSHSYEFFIKSRNDEGESIESSRIFVPKFPSYYEKISPKSITNVYHNSTYTLEWTPPDDLKKLKDYTIFWCTAKRAIPNECKENLGFKHINKHLKKFTTETQTQDHSLILAVAANYADGFSSGMHWPICTSSITNELVQMHPEITAVVPRTLEIQWSSDSLCTSHVEGYNLTYCRVDNGAHSEPSEQAGCLAAPVTLIIDKTKSKFQLAELQPYATYKVYMNMFSALKVGKASKAQLRTTLEEAPSPPRSLKYQNVTKDSAWLSWTPPVQANGLIRFYIIYYNNETHTLNCTGATDNEGCGNGTQEISFKLENLSSFWGYKVYIRAHTVNASEPSNDIHFRTEIGSPSPPRNIESNHSRLSWSPPKVPSGKVEFYEVAVTELYKGEVQRKRISSVVGSTHCALSLFECRDKFYRYTLQVRAVNVAQRGLQELDADTDAAFYEGNDDLRCNGTTGIEAAQLLKQQDHPEDTILYKSAWENGAGYGCVAPSMLGRTSIYAVLVVIVSALVFVLFYVTRIKIKKMADIGCRLPPELESLPPHITKGGSEAGRLNGVIKEAENFKQSKESFFINEQQRLLDYFSSPANGGVTGVITPASNRKSSGYVGSECSDEYVQRAENVDQTSATDSPYMAMEVRKQHDVQKAPNFEKASDDGYVPPGAGYTSAIGPQPLIFPAVNGYIKPNMAFSRLTEPNIVNTASIPTGGDYVAPQMLQKPAIAPSSDGYTTLDALGKSTQNSTLHAATSPLHTAGEVGALPMSGYVTQKELSAFGQLKMS